mmetsp:Transcript_9389/g.14322  ORF Transcript_9389/g.14322 Transcript_9389/m.14322 type:complete len:94 (+) Transcript_9389:513-794(+)
MPNMIHPAHHNTTGHIGADLLTTKFFLTQQPSGSQEIRHPGAHMIQMQQQQQASEDKQSYGFSDISQSPRFHKEKDMHHQSKKIDDISKEYIA